MSEQKKGWGCGTKFLVGIGILFFLSIIGKLFGPTKKEPPQIAKKQESTQIQPSQKPVIEPSPEPPKSAGHYLDEAKKALADKSKERPYGRIYEAAQLLANINKDDKAYKEAHTLSKKIEKLAERDRKRMAREREKEEEAKRILYAPLCENAFLDKGWDVTVTVIGKKATTLKIKWILVSRPLVHQIAKDASLFQTWRSMGFKKVIFTDGFRQTWYFDL